MSKTAIVGFGCAGYHAAKALREADPDAQIDVYTDTPDAPANPMLTTYYVAGRITRDTLLPYGPAGALAEALRLTLYTAHVQKLYAAERTLALADGERRSYDDIVLATGSHPLIPPIAGLPADRAGIYAMRTPADADKLLSAIQDGLDSAVVIGASWVGIKVVEALVAHQVPTVMADMAPRIFPTATLPDVAEIIQARIRAMGIGLKFGSGISSICRESGEMISSFADGETLRSGLVALCMGLRPTLDYIDPADFEMGRGLRVDARQRTSVPHIYAVGDCCEGKELVTGQPMAINLWANAFAQGAVAGQNIAGLDAEYQGNFLHNITHFLDMDFIGLGDNRSQGELIRYRHPTDGWLFEAIVGEDRPGCINILDNRRVSGPAKAALIQRFTEPEKSLSPVARMALHQSGLPESIIDAIGGDAHA